MRGNCDIFRQFCRKSMLSPLVEIFTKIFFSIVASSYRYSCINGLNVSIVYPVKGGHVRISD